MPNLRAHKFAGHSPRRQSGAATLFITVIVLFLTTVLVVTVSKSAIMEQIMSANEIRQRQAFEAAQAGMDRALAYFKDVAAGGIDQDLDNVADDLTPNAVTLGNGSKYRVVYCNPGSALGQCPNDPTSGNPTCDTPTAVNLKNPVVFACGWSDDNVGRVAIIQSFAMAESIAKTPSNPLTAKGAINVQGSATVTNYYSNLTIWTGGQLSSVGNSGKTFIRNPDVAPPDTTTAPPGEPANCGTTADYVCPTDKNHTGPDVIDIDPTLGNLTNAQMFLNFFGQTFAEYQSTASQVIDAGDIGSVNGVMDQSIIVNGDTSFTGGMTFGSRDRPVVMVINGNLTGGANVTVYGVLYVMGNVDVAGNMLVQGAAVVQGTISGTGSLDVMYDPFALDNASKVGVPGPLSGSWRDWL
ncbi:pilus assembly PilX family protein [Parasulfuritortus cantonensis]|nr:PilX N-terminal domain-containing pilus assembly protein [Parasulfuritortus cantonensis]